jgi:hypothetical protein
MIAALAILAGSGLSAAALAAPTAGTYTGTSADGQGISLTVGTDGNGDLAITSASISIQATCMPGGTTAYTGWGYGQDAVIAKNKFSYVESFDYLYEPVKGTFSGDTITGTISSDVPGFAAVTKGAPTKSVFCKSLTQSFTATLSASASLKAPGVAIYNGPSK